MSESLPFFAVSIFGKPLMKLRATSHCVTVFLTGGISLSNIRDEDDPP
jgi:hypothetical protein